MMTLPLHHFEVTRQLGLLKPPAGFVSALPRLEQTVPALALGELHSIAASGVADGRQKFDWVTGLIADQGSAGSCNGWAGARALTRARIRRGLSPVLLSGSYLYSLINGGRDNGSMLEDGMLTLQSRGCASDAVVSANEIYPSQYDRQKADHEASYYKAFECYAVETMEGLFTAAAIGFDLVVAVDVQSDFSKLDVNGFPHGGSGGGNHAVAADGMIAVNGELALTAYNSWGPRWGQNGRMLLTWSRHFVKTFHNHTFYAIRSSTDGNESPPAIT